MEAGVDNQVEEEIHLEAVDIRSAAGNLAGASLGVANPVVASLAADAVGPMAATTADAAAEVVEDAETNSRLPVN